MSTELELGFANLGEGYEQALTDVRADFTRTHRRVMDRVEAGELGFWELPINNDAEQISDFIDALPPQIKSVLVLGIGGSSLGGRTLVTALQGPPEVPGHRGRKVLFPDNSDPTLLAGLLGSLKPEQTLALVISKSGGTVETIASYLVVREWMRNALGDDHTKHLVMITDPENGPLRQTAQTESIASFVVPSNVGGRFSALTAVGLLPSALAEVDIAAVLSGAAACRERCQDPNPDTNPAAALALSLVAHARCGRTIHVLMPYADVLRPLSAWFVQLWAESLGKRVDQTGAVVEVGPTPLPAVGATDQHAQVQLFMEGPRDKVVVFVRVATHANDITIPQAEGPFAYLGGKSMVELLNAEHAGTCAALAADGRPSMTLQLEQIDARSVGALLFLFEAATAFAGELYHIEAFDQPGVEAGKRFAMGLLGRSGYEESREKVAEVMASASSASVTVLSDT